MSFGIVSCLSLKDKEVLGRLLVVAYPEPSREMTHVRWKVNVFPDVMRLNNMLTLNT